MRRMTIVPLSRVKGQSPLVLTTDWQTVHVVPSDERVLWDTLELRVTSDDAVSAAGYSLRLNGCPTVAAAQVAANGGIVGGRSVLFPGDTIEMKADAGDTITVFGHAERALQE